MSEGRPMPEQKIPIVGVSPSITLDFAQLRRVLEEVATERLRQHMKWGEQQHPNGTGRGHPAGPGHVRWAADQAREECQFAASRGECTWGHILAEEVAEAFAETIPARLRAELVQVAAVAVQWIEAIDRAQAERCACGDDRCQGITDEEHHQCGGPREACGVSGCPECGS